MKKYVDVILPLPLPKYFTYSLPDECAEEVEIGCRVIVPFGRKKFYTAIVRNVHYCAPTEYEVKDISALLDALLFYCPLNLSFGSGWQITISVHKETFIKRHFLPV